MNFDVIQIVRSRQRFTIILLKYIKTETVNLFCLIQNEPLVSAVVWLKASSFVLFHKNTPY